MKDHDTRVLLVDDDVAMTKFMSFALMDLGDYRFKEAKNGMEALHKLETNKKPDLIITDVDMPLMDGIEFYKQAIDKYAFMAERFIFITSNDKAEVVSFFKEYNLKYLIKPVHINEFRNFVIEFMEQENKKQ
ncbi:MAG: response regulator [Deltaproteobacteria bacterium]|nr:response regulator [Deltaproteobacteria bacterium]